MNSQEIKARIQTLINQQTKIKEQSTTILNQLFKKLENIREVELISKLPSQYLEAYLVYRQAFYSNYQAEHLKQAEFSQASYLERISSEVDLLEKDKDLPEVQPTNEELLRMLGERIATGEIKRELSSFGNYLMIEIESGIFKVDLHDGKTTSIDFKRLKAEEIK